MNDFKKNSSLMEKYLALNLHTSLTYDERIWVESTLKKFEPTGPSIRDMWTLLDEVWNYYGCDQFTMDNRIYKFYSHPVWLLNGLHIESDFQSILNRKVFADWISKQKPKRIADFGGGFGGLARMVGALCSDCEIEIIEPHPHQSAINLANCTKNIRYQNILSGTYDIIIATDVFEHVSDPILLINETCTFLRNGGKYLIGNCFEPVILCHLPNNFHFGGTWDHILNDCGLHFREKVQYASVHEYSGNFNINLARNLEDLSQKLYRYISFFPRRIQKVICKIFFSLK